MAWKEEWTMDGDRKSQNDMPKKWLSIDEEGILCIKIKEKNGK